MAGLLATCNMTKLSPGSTQDWRVLLPTACVIVREDILLIPLVVQVDGASHVVHSEAEAAGMRLTIDSKTCLLPNEHDPSQLMSASPGKLVRYLVADGAHVQADEAYAEIEVSRRVWPEN